MQPNRTVPKWFVETVEPRPDYTLNLTFATGERKVFDARPLLAESCFKRLRNLEFFMQAHLQGRSVVWDEETDIAPEYLYEESRNVV